MLKRENFIAKSPKAYLHADVNVEGENRTMSVLTRAGIGFHSTFSLPVASYKRWHMSITHRHSVKVNH